VSLVLAAAITGWIAAVLAAGLVFYRSRQCAQLLEQARTDWTGLLTKAAWRRDAEIELARASRTLTPLALAILDVDHFKHINDRFGHLAGDQVLSVAAEAIRSLLRRYDLAGRFGGDEVVLLFPGTTGRQAECIVNRVRSAMSSAALAIDIGGITISAGISELAGGITGLDGLLAAADAALYEAKRAGRNRTWRAGSPATGYTCPTRGPAARRPS
jgi:diguanylate cyclase (GGDEF)-like protein